MKSVRLHQTRTRNVGWVALMFATLLLFDVTSVLAKSGESTMKDAENKSMLPENPVAEDWLAFSTRLHALGDKVLARAPARLRNDPVMQQQINRLLLAAMSRTANDALIGNRQQPMFVPELNIALNIYQPNADTVYKSALIDGRGVYRISGARGSILYALLGQLGPDMLRTGVGSAPISYLNFDNLKLDTKGRYSFILSRERPQHYKGDWWYLSPKTEKLMLRQVSYDWPAEVDTSIAIERLDTPAASGALSAEKMQYALHELPAMIFNAAVFFVNHVEDLRNNGFLNKFTIFDVSNMAGLEGQSYYEGAYELASDEALLLEVKIPEQCKYWSVILTNDLYQTTDWYNNHSSLNGSQAKVDEDGFFRAVIAASDPGVHNWLDTAGYNSGAIQGRWLECSQSPLPALKKIKLDGLAQQLPENTTRVSRQEREQLIRARREALHLRRLW